MSEDTGWDIDEDLGDAEEGADAHIGRYLVKINDMEMKTSKDGSKEYFNLEFKLIDCTNPVQEKSIGRSVWDIFNFGESALWKLKGLVVACRGKEAADKMGKRVPNLKGEMLMLDVYEDEYEGNHNLRTKKYKAKEMWNGLNQNLTEDAPEPDETDGTNGSKQLPPGEVEI